MQTRRVFLIEKGGVYIQNEAGDSISFNSLKEFKRVSGIDLTAKKYICYEPDLKFYVDSALPHVNFAEYAPNVQYDSFIANVELFTKRKVDPYYGLDTEEAKLLALNKKLINIKIACDDADLEPFLFDGQMYKSTNAISDTVNKINMLDLSDSDPIPCNIGYWDNLDLTVSSSFTCGQYKQLAGALYQRADDNYQNFKSLIATARQKYAEEAATAYEIDAIDHTTGWV